MSIAALVRVSRLHENTVREHLNALVTTGLVRRTRGPTAGRGRPPWLYQAWETEPGEADYAGLAAVLSRALAQSAADPAAVAEAHGRAWGRDMLTSRRGSHAGSVGETMIAMLDDLRFAPRVEPGAPTVVRLERCPLLETAHQFPQVVCAVHLGLVRGVLEQLGETTEGTELQPFAEPGACRLVVPQLARPGH